MQMNWITNFVRPKIRGDARPKRDVPENLWIKCPETGEMVFHKDLEDNQFVIPGSGYHMKMAPEVRLKHIVRRRRVRAEIELPEVAVDPLKFRDEKQVCRPAEGRARQDRPARCRSWRRTARSTGLTTVAVVQDFAFMGGSLGMAAGEAHRHGHVRGG